MTRVEVLTPGALTTIQDLGRPGWGHIGVPRSGAADRRALVLANRLVGNADGAAALETTLAGPRLRFDGAATVALSGAPVRARLDGRALGMNEALEVGPGDELKLGNASAGLRSYIAFAGGIDAPLVLGSAATDVLTGLGPAALAPGVVLALGAIAGGGRTARSPAPDPPPPWELPESVVLGVIVGPRSDWFTDASIKRLLSEPFTISQASNRIGIRLDGPVLERARPGELRSEGLVSGALQVPPDGRPILLLADHPTTGGYPVAAVVSSNDLGLAAQLRPGQEVRFRVAEVS
ncbi:MAG TPA: biotin-dependent carboxyltransferase family protein [Solirubrobacteraceae bacterium]|nr:biotin-dependent carboxyltransferase family protein [Solirubrobacteraceae bacterium]